MREELFAHSAFEIVQAYQGWVKQLVHEKVSAKAAGINADDPTSWNVIQEGIDESKQEVRKSGILGLLLPRVEVGADVTSAPDGRKAIVLTYDWPGALNEVPAVNRPGA